MLSAERAEQALVTGDATAAASLLEGMDAFASGVGLIPEQDWTLPDLAASPFGTDPTLASIGFANGGAAGSASPLTWSAASFVRLAADLAAKRNVALPAVTHSRYVAHAQGTTTLTVTSPADGSSVAGSPVTVTGTTAAGNKVYVSATNTDAQLGDDRRLHDRCRGRLLQRRRRGHRRHERAQHRRRQRRPGGTAHAKRTILFDFVPGTLIFDVTDPDGDDNGPGNYAYPTSDNFKPGAFDIQEFQVYDAGSERDLPAQDA